MATFLPNVTDKFADPALYTPNFGFLDTMLRRRQSMYDAGFAQVNAQNSYLNRNLTHAANQEARDQFVRSAQDQLKNLSSLDLSQQQNVQNALQVYQPFYKNTRILRDMALTAHWDQQEAIADSFRLKDGGKEYSQINLNYVRKQREQFRNDAPESADYYLANKRSYTPYYNYQEEIAKAMKDFKPNSYKYDRINGYYKITEENKSAKEDDIHQYLSAVLSDRAKEQMRIEADVKLNNNPAALASVYSSLGDVELQRYDSFIASINKQIAQTKNKDQRAALEAMRDKRISEKDVVKSRLDKIKEGDLSYIKSNAPELAYSLYYNQKMAEISKGYSYDDITQTIGADEVGLALMKEDRADARERSRQSHAEKMKQWELQGIPGQNFDITQLSIGQDAQAVKTDYETSQKEIEKLDKGLETITMQQKQYVLAKAQERNPNLKITDITPAFIQTWLKTGSKTGGAIAKNDMYHQFTDKLADLQGQKDVVTNRIKSVEERVMKDMTPAERDAVRKANNSIISKGDIKLDDGTTINAADFLAAYNAGTLDVSERIYGGYQGGEGSNIYEFKINGKTIKASSRFNSTNPGGSNQGLIGLYKDIIGSQQRAGKAYNKYKSNISTSFEKNFEPINLKSNLATFRDGSAQAKDLENSISSVLPPGYNIKQRGVGTDATNQGKAYFYINTDKNAKVSMNDIEGYITQAGFQVKKIDQGGGNFVYEVGGLRSRVAQQFANFTPMESTVVNSLISHTGKDAFVSVPFKVPGSDSRFTIRKQNDMYFLNIVGEGDSFPSGFADPADAVMQARILTANNEAGLKKYLSY